MLAAAHRLRRSADFRTVLRGRAGGRSGSELLVVYAVRSRCGDSPPGVVRPPRVGFVVSKAVGNSVVRSRIKRVLRHLAAAQLHELPDGTDVVVRANPALVGVDTAGVEAAFKAQLRTALARSR